MAKDPLFYRNSILRLSETGPSHAKSLDDLKREVERGFHQINRWADGLRLQVVALDEKEEDAGVNIIARSSRPVSLMSAASHIIDKVKDRYTFIGALLVPRTVTLGATPTWPIVAFGLTSTTYEFLDPLFGELIGLSSTLEQMLLMPSAGVSRILAPGDTIRMNVTTAAGGTGTTAFTVDVFILGALLETSDA